ncbi:hypothetical protein N7G274_010077 [Stereocaulon virgatum]|uniref:Uncharacterized protein n=1 Tax=Stereocaulon virgatum TaxID=373712 RepID=A0ABR3ZUF5_9LECA
MLQEHFQDRFAPIVSNFDNRGHTALHSAFICGQLQNIAVLLEEFGADPTIPIRDTSVDSITLAMLARTYPNAYTRMFSEGSQKKYDEDMATVFDI